jgi:hypothetical protein
MTNADSWLKFSISRSVSVDNGKLGIGRWDEAPMESYAKLVTDELVNFIDTEKLTYSDFEKYNNDSYYTLAGKLTFDASDPTPARTHLKILEQQLAKAFNGSTHIDVEAMVINGFTFTKDAIFSSQRDAFSIDLLHLTDAIKDVVSLTVPWFEYQINGKDLQADTLIPLLETQINHMETTLADAKAMPFTGQGGNKTHERQTQVFFMNVGAKGSVMSDIIRSNVVNGNFHPEDIISELKAAREAFVQLTSSMDFFGRAPRFNPGNEVSRLAREFGPTIDKGGAQMRPEYLEKTLSDFPLDTINGKMMRYGMFLASQLALEIIEGMGGTANIRDFHSRMANELGAIVEPPTPGAEDDLAKSPGL